MITPEEFRTIKISDFIDCPSGDEREEVEFLFGVDLDDDRLYDDIWLAGSYEGEQYGVLEFRYGEYSGEGLVAVEMNEELVTNPHFPDLNGSITAEQSYLLRSEVCKSIGCFDIGTTLEKLTYESTQSNFEYVVKPLTERSSSMYILQGGLLVEYLVAENTVIGITIFDLQLVLKNRIETLVASLKSAEEAMAEEGDVETWKEVVERDQHKLDEIRSYDAFGLKSALKIVFAE